MAAAGRRPGLFSPRRGGLLGSLGPLIAAMAIVVGCGTVTPTPTAMTPATASAPPTSTQTPPATADTWTAVTVSDLVRPADLVPTRSSTNGVARDTAFVLTSLDGRPATELASHVVASPAIAFSIRTEGAKAVLTPKAQLAASTTYRLSLQRADGTVEAAWSAVTTGPLAITGTVPGSNATGVPLVAGVELSFNQAGVTAAELQGHFSISPKIDGTFTAAGRSVAFAPSTPLTKATLYTVTVTRGLAPGAGEALAADYTFQFETAGTAESPVRVWFNSSLVDASTRERPAFGINASVPEGSSEPTTLPVTVHRLADMAAAQAAWQAVEASPEWTEVSRTAPVATAKLPLVLDAKVGLSQVPEGEGSWFALPKALPLGWYVVTEQFGGIPRQAVLQVTDTAVYTLVSTTQSALWVNSLATLKPITGATATMDGSPLAGATDARGLLVASTPRTVATGKVAQPVLVVSAAGRTTFHLVRQIGYCGKCEFEAGAAPATRPWWAIVSSDRYEYRSTDTVNVYGIVRLRSDRTVPSSVTVGIWTNAAASTGGAPVVAATVSPDARGMYAAHLALADLPTGLYRIVARVGSAQVAEAWLRVSSIRKPAYGLALATDHRAYIDGTPIRTTVTGTFFDGTPVAGAAVIISLNGDGDRNIATVTTDLRGVATGGLTATLDSKDQRSIRTVDARPAAPEESDISQMRDVAVFAGADYITVDGTASSKSVSLTGAVNAVVLSRYDKVPGSIWDVDPRGDPRPSRTVEVTGTAEVETVVKTGTAYDFLTKRVEPTYRTERTTADLPTQTTRTKSDGSFKLGFRPVASAVSYTFSVTVVDAAGRRVSTEKWVWVDTGRGPSSDPQLQNAADPSGVNAFSIGNAVRVRFTGGDPAPTAQRYFFAVLQEGLTSASVGTSATFRTTFNAASVPSIHISAAKFNGKGYDVVPWGFQASTRLTDHAVKVTLAADQKRYQPGATATVSITTTGPDGRPVASSVFIQAVDEKLHAMGATRDDDIAAELYAPLDAGVLGAAVSHRTPRQLLGGGKGDTTGGDGTGGRTDFRDWLVAQVVKTDARGRASITIPLSDDLTSWRVTGTAVDGALDVGSGEVLLAVGLPFFADAIIAPEYLASDRPSVTVRSFGTALHAADDVTFTVSSDTLPMAATTVKAKGFSSASVALPPLTVGTHTLRVAAVSGSGSARLQDAMTRTFTVVASRATATRMTWTVLSGATAVQSGPTLTTLTLADAGRGRVIPVLQGLATPNGTRVDSALAWSVASRTLASEFGLTSSGAVPAGLLSNFWADGGLAVVPWGSADLDATALAAMTADPQLDRGSLAEPLQKAAFSTTETRARRLLALAGLAALGERVIGDVRTAAAQTDLTVEEQINLALAAWFAGDEPLAATLKNKVLAAHGQTYAGQVRIDAGAGVDATVATARLAIVAASLGDPLAAGMDAWVADHPSRTTLVALERALAARGWAGRVPGATATATVTIGGQTQTLTLQPGRPVELALTPAQAAGARIAPTSGSVLAVSRWDAPLDTAKLDRASGISIMRTPDPAGTVDALHTVAVTIRVNLGTSDPRDGWRVVDLAPSGLLPVVASSRGADDGTGDTYLFPVRIDGQRVEFSVGGDPTKTSYTLRYLARVVTAGTYAWEPAVMQADADPSAGVATPATTISITSAPG